MYATIDLILCQCTQLESCDRKLANKPKGTKADTEVGWTPLFMLSPQIYTHVKMHAHIRISRAMVKTC